MKLDFIYIYKIFVRDQDFCLPQSWEKVFSLLSNIFLSCGQYFAFKIIFNPFLWSSIIVILPQSSEKVLSVLSNTFLSKTWRGLIGN